MRADLCGMGLIKKADVPTAVFGGWDGAISVLAVLLASSHLGARQLLVAGFGGAVGGCFSMGSGQWESMDGAPSVKTRESIVMALATLLGGLLPALPFLAGSKLAGYLVGILAVIGLATVVWVIKWRTATESNPWPHAVQAYALLAITAAATVGVSLVIT